MLAAGRFDDPLFWALLIGWIMSVVLHEFAHGLVAYAGGDWTVRERGGLTLNPLQYVDPMMSLLLPAIFLMMGGIPLPGGATYIRTDLLRSRAWQSAVSLAGPVMNLLLFFACAIPLHPQIGWAEYGVSAAEWTNPQAFLAAMAILQLLAVMLNLVPVPPLDGFGAISPYMDPSLRTKLTTPPLSVILFVGYFLIVAQVPVVIHSMYAVVDRVLIGMGFGDFGVDQFSHAFNRIVWGSG